MVEPITVGRAFLGAVPPGANAQGSPFEIGRWILAIDGGARAKWPTVAVDAEVFARALGRLFPAEGAGVDAWLRNLHSYDVYLAAACETGDDEALQAFDRAFLGDVGKYVHRIGRDAAFADDVAQAVREKLFLGVGDGVPRISTYEGRGALAGWVRIFCVRIAQNMTRGAVDRRAASDASDVIAALPAHGDPELEYAKTRHGREFRRALGDALKALPDEQQALLRLHYGGEHLSTPRLGEMYRVNASTIVRRLAAAREALVAKTHELIRSRLNLGGAELESLAALVRSRIGESFLDTK